MTARPIRYQRQVSDRKGKIFYTSITSLSHISKQAQLKAVAPHQPAMAIDGFQMLSNMHPWPSHGKILLSYHNLRQKDRGSQQKNNKSPSHGLFRGNAPPHKGIDKRKKICYTAHKGV